MPLARWLLEKGATPNDCESLYHATELGHAEGLRLLLEFGARPARTNGLLRALDFDNLEMVKLLLAAGAGPNEQSGGAQPALHHAARRMVSGPVLDALLDQGADPALTWQGHSASAFAQVFGNTDMVDRMTERGHVTPLTDLEQMLATAATGQVPDGYIDPAKLPAAYANLLHDVLHLSGKVAHLRALVAIGMEWERPDDAGVTPVRAAGWNGLMDVMAFFLSLSPNLGHINAYGGTLLSTILHGAEANPTRAQGDYNGCLRLALEHGVALLRRAIPATRRSDITAFLQNWAEVKRGQVVEHDAV
jgi:ankyrin repeat protein